VPSFSPVYSDSIVCLPNTDALYSVDVLRGLPDGQHKVSVNKVDNTLVRAIDVRLFLDVAPSTDPNGNGYLALYMLGGISPNLLSNGYTGSSYDVWSLSHATLLAAIPCNSNSVIQTEISVLTYVSSLPKYFTFALQNKCGVSLATNRTNRMDMVFVNYEYL